MKKTYDDVLIEYKAILKLWYKGTGGGSGNSTLFENWYHEKLDKYDVDVDIYDHTKVSMRLSILMDKYVNKKKYITVIFLWGELSYHLLSSKYDPVMTKGGNEMGIPKPNDTSVSGISTTSSRTSKYATREMED